MESVNTRPDFWFVIFLLEGVIIIFCNVLGLIIFTKKARHSRACFLLVNLCLADFVSGIKVLFHSFMHYRNYEGESSSQQLFTKLQRSTNCPSFVLNMYHAVWIMGMDVSLLSLSLIALERVYAIFKPFKHRVMENKTYFQAVLVTWAVTLTHSLFYFYRLCHQISKESSAILFGIIFIIVAGSFLILITSYLAIYIKLRYFPIFHHSSQTRNEFKLCRILFYASLASIVTFLPTAVIQLFFKIKCAENSKCLSPYFNYIKEGFLFANHFINFIVYAWMFPGFTKSLRKLLVCRFNVHNRIHVLEKRS